MVGGAVFACINGRYWVGQRLVFGLARLKNRVIYAYFVGEPCADSRFCLRRHRAVVWDLGKQLVALGHRVSYLVPTGSHCDFAQVLPLQPNQPWDAQIPADVDVTHFQFDPQLFMRIDTGHRLLNRSDFHNMNLCAALDKSRFDRGIILLDLFLNRHLQTIRTQLILHNLRKG